MDAQGTSHISTSQNPIARDAREHLESLIKRAAAKDLIKDYAAAAELYSEATEIQAQLNGELSLDNADLLFAYGKALYNVAISKSDVLGSKVAGKSQTQRDAKHQPSTSGSPAVPKNLIKDAVSAGAANKEAKAQQVQVDETEQRPYFQFTGDENFETDSDEEDRDRADDDNDDDDDDFANAFEVLDLARILYHKKLSAVDEQAGKGKTTAVAPGPRDLQERLADTYDLQAEISLEGERFTDAVADLRSALALRQSLFPSEDPSIAECHYKLSLALEFGAVKHDNDHPGPGAKSAEVDEEMRKESVSHMEKAIESCRIRMSQEQKKLETDGSLDEDKRTALRRRIANVKEIVADMEQRLLDLRRPPVSIEAGIDEQSESMLKGILGQIIGQSASEQQSLLNTATKNATDLSAFVKRKPAATRSPQQTDATQKRPAEGREEAVSKKARVEDTDKSGL